MLEYSWIGNIRELKNAVSYAQLRARIQDKKLIDERCLPAEILNSEPIIPVVMQGNPAGGEMGAAPAASPASPKNIDEEHALIDLDRIEKLLIQKNKVKKDVAIAIGLENTDNLRYRIKKHFDKHPHLFANFPTISQSYRRIVKL